MSKITSLSTTQQEKLNTHCQKLHDFILHSGKDLTREEVESYIEWIYSKIGKPNAAVLPVPVCAVPNTSFPSSATGIAPACTGVGTVSRARFRFSFNKGAIDNSSNVFIDC